MSKSPKMRRNFRALTTAAAVAAIGLSGCSQLGLDNMFNTSSRVGDTPDYATASVPSQYKNSQIETGIAGWDGDMSSPGMTAAHTTMAPGSWARVTNARSGDSAVVRITRRLSTNRGRSIELSRDAAAQIGALQDGYASVLIEPIDPRQSTPQERSWSRAQPTPVETVQPYQPSVAAYQAPRAPTGGVEVAYSPDIATASVPRSPGYAPAMAPVMAPVMAQPQALGLRYLQLGSYRDAKNAQRMLDRLTTDGMTNGVYGDGFVETAYVGGQVYHRVRLGPIETNDQAQRALRDAKALGHKGARILRP